MRKIFQFCFAAFLTLGVLSSCQSDDPDEPTPQTPQEILEGKWIINSSEILGTTVPGDGSYLQFNACDPTCGGIDFNQSDTTMGTFTYDLNDAATVLVINDDTDDGGNYNYSWDILELSETELRMVASTILGSLQIELRPE